MSQTTRLARARGLTIAARPGNVMNGYGNLIAARLRRIAEAGGTGVLPFVGPGAGAVYFADGRVTYAESARTPGAVAMAAVPAGLFPLAGLTAVLAVTEATTDACLELLASEARYAMFRTAELPAAGRACGIPLEALLAEVARRRRLLRQLSAAVTADTRVIRTPGSPAPHVRVPALQRALLVRVQDGTTPRELAWQLGRSVFGTTVEAHRLMLLGLLSDAGPAAAAGSAPPAGRPREPDRQSSS